MGQSCTSGKPKTPMGNSTASNPLNTAPPDLRSRKEAYEKKISFKEATNSKEIVNMATGEDMFEYLILGKSLKDAMKKVKPKDNEEVMEAIKELIKMISSQEEKFQSSYKFPETCKQVIIDMNTIFSKKFTKYEKYKKNNRNRETIINILRIVTDVYNILKFYKKSNKMDSDQNKWWSDAKFMNNFNVVVKRHFMEAAGDMERDKPDDGYPPSERGNTTAPAQVERVNSKKHTLEKQATDLQRAEAERDAKIFIDNYLDSVCKNDQLKKKCEELIDQEIKNMEIDDNHSASACKGYAINKKVMKRNGK